MGLFAKPVGAAVSDGAKERIAMLQAYPTLDTWRNPLTRGLARRLAHDTWMKSQQELDFDFRLTDVEIGDVPCTRYETTQTRPNGDLILYLHGGGFLAGSPRANASMILPACELSGLEAIGVDYSLVPEARYPVALDEVDAVYRSLVEQNPKRRIIMFSDSMGCVLNLACQQRWRADGGAMPAASVFISPILDGKGGSDTHITLDAFDPLLTSKGGRDVRKLFQFYAPGADLADPRISPIYGDFTGLPPMLIHVGTRDVCLGDSARLAEKMRLNHRQATLRVFDGMFHLFHMHWSIEETKNAFQDIAAFIGKIKGSP